MDLDEVAFILLLGELILDVELALSRLWEEVDDVVDLSFYRNLSVLATLFERVKELLHLGETRGCGDKHNEFRNVELLDSP